jgi:hypothetical protein
MSLAKLRHEAKVEAGKNKGQVPHYDKTSGVSVRKPLLQRKLRPIKRPEDEEDDEYAELRNNPAALARLLLKMHNDSEASVPSVVQEALAMAKKTVALLENPKTLKLLEKERIEVEKMKSVDSYMDKVSEARADTFISYAIKGDLGEVMRRIEANLVPHIDSTHSTLLFTALQGASSFGHLPVVKALIKSGANPNSKDLNHGNTPMHHAAQNGRLDVIVELKSQGAVVPAQNYHGEKPSDLAREYHKIEAETLLWEVANAPEEIHCTALAARAATLSWTIQPFNADMPPIDVIQFRYKMLPAGRLNEALVLPSPDEEIFDPVYANSVNEPWLFHDTDAAPPFKLHGVFPASNYVCCVRFRNKADYSDSTAYSIDAEPGWSGYSNTTVFRTQDAPPSKPGPAEMFSTTAQSITIQWQPPKYSNGTEVMQYDLQFCVSPLDDAIDQGMASLEEMEWQRMLTKLYVKRGEDHHIGPDDGDEEEMEHHMLEEGVTRYTIFGLRPYTYYFFRLRALNDDGWGEWSRVGEPILATDAVGFTTVTPRSILLHWQRPQDCIVMAYELQQRLAQDDSWHTLSNTLPLEPLQYLADHLEPFTEYQFRLRALEPGGWRAWRHNAAYSRVIPTLACEPETPGTPRPLEVYFDQVVVTFEKAINNGGWVNCYELLGRQAGDDEWSMQEIAQVDPTGAAQEPECAFKKLQPDIEYEFKVRAHNKLGWSEFSGVSERIKTRATLPPGQPKLLNVGASYVELYWDPPEDFTKPVKFYEMQFKAEPAGYKKTMEKAGGKATGMEFDEWTNVPCKTKAPRGMVTDLKPDTKHLFRVRSLTAEGWSNFSKHSVLIATTRRC